MAHEPWFSLSPKRPLWTKWSQLTLAQICEAQQVKVNPSGLSKWWKNHGLVPSLYEFSTGQDLWSLTEPRKFNCDNFINSGRLEDSTLTSIMKVAM
jgi:hypothetical protein